MTTTAMDARGFTRAAQKLVGADPALAAIVERHGMPGFWRREPGFATLVLLILEQQVSLASARAAFDRLEAVVGRVEPAALLELDDDALRAVGFSRQKTRYARELSRAILEGRLDLAEVACLSDDDARSALTALPGIGPWTADVYLLACLSRPDVWPVGDVALQAAAQQALALGQRPTATDLEAIGERWRPYRSIAAQLLWHLYLGERHRV